MRTLLKSLPAPEHTRSQPRPCCAPSAACYCWPAPHRRHGHEVRPAYLEHQGNGLCRGASRSLGSSRFSVTGACRIDPELPEHCDASRRGIARRTPARRSFIRWQVRLRSLSRGMFCRSDGLTRTLTDVLVRIDPAGQAEEIAACCSETRTEPSLNLGGSSTAGHRRLPAPGRRPPAPRHRPHPVRDWPRALHPRYRWMLLKTITAFTVAHSDHAGAVRARSSCGCPRDPWKPSLRCRSCSSRGSCWCPRSSQLRDHAPAALGHGFCLRPGCTASALPARSRTSGCPAISSGPGTAALQRRHRARSAAGDRRAAYSGLAGSSKRSALGRRPEWRQAFTDRSWVQPGRFLDHRSDVVAVFCSQYPRLRERGS